MAQCIMHCQSIAVFLMCAAVYFYVAKVQKTFDTYVVPRQQDEQDHVCIECFLHLAVL